MGKAQAHDSADDKDGFVDELKPGTKLMHGQYTIEQFLNAGGFGITYLAKDSLDRKIVIKECFPGAFCRRSRYVVQARSRAHQNELKSIVRLFVQEARSLAKLNHPNIVGVHQVFEDNETAYMALDFVEGRDLLDTIEDPNHGLTPAQIKIILKEVLGAVGFIHDQGILHRDISPDNILINAQFHPVLIDFGAAREEATKQSRVLSALRVVKDGYSPQEFYIAGSEQSPSSDLYALGASFYHLIAGDTPPNSQARLAAIASGESDPFVPLAGSHPEYEDAFLSAIDKALAVLPKDRLQSAQEWLEVMDGVQGNVTPLKVAKPAADAKPSKPAAASDPAAKSKMPMLLGSVAVVAVLVGAGLMMMPSGEDTPAPSTVAVAPAPAPAPEPTVVEPEPTTAAPETAVVAPETPAATDPVTDAIAEALESTPAPVVDAPAVVENVAPAVEEPATVVVDAPETPAITEETSARTAGADVATDTAIIGGPEIATQDTVVPAIRPTSRPETAEFATLPEIVRPPLPEPVITPRPASVDPVAPAVLSEEAITRPVMAGGIDPVVPMPGTPDAINAVGAGPAVDILAVTPGNALPPPPVSSGWTVQLPFEPTAPGSNEIGAIGAVTPVWVRPGLEITSVNGAPVSSIAQIPSTLRREQSGAPGDTLQVMFGTRDPNTGETAEHAWIMPVIQRTDLLNGLSFQTVFAGSDWRTSVTNVPESVTTDLQIGDVVTMYIPTSESINARDTIGTVVAREIESGTEQFMFAVQREGSMWVASLMIDNDQN